MYKRQRLGRFHKIADAGLTIIIPFVDHVRSVVSLKEQTLDVPPQGVITKDNVTMTIDTVVFYQITDPAKAVYEIQSLRRGIEYLAITTIRDIVGKSYDILLTVLRHQKYDISSNSILLPRYCYNR